MLLETFAVVFTTSSDCSNESTSISTTVVVPLLADALGIKLGLVDAKAIGLSVGELDSISTTSVVLLVVDAGIEISVVDGEE